MTLDKFLSSIWHNVKFILLAFVIFSNLTNSYAQTNLEELNTFANELLSAGVTESTLDSIDKTREPEKYIIALLVMMKTNPDYSPNIDKDWYNSLSKENQEMFNSVLALIEGQKEGNNDIKHKIPQEIKENTKRYQGEYSNDKWVTIGAGNEGFKYFGDATYSYIDNPDKKATQTRIYQGWFSFYGARNSRIQDLRGEFNMDKQVGKWQCIFHYDGEYYWVKVNFNDKGEIEGDFAIYVGRKLPESNISPDGMRLMYSGTVKNHYVTKLNYEGTRFNRTVKIVNGRYGSGNGHPAYQWNIQLTDDTNPRSTMYNNLSHLKKGVYSIQYVKTDSKASQWGEDDNWATWKEYGKCFYVEQSTGERKDAGRDIAEIPLRLSNEAAGLLNVVVMRDSSGVKRYYNPY